MQKLLGETIEEMQHIPFNNKKRKTSKQFKITEDFYINKPLEPLLEIYNDNKRLYEVYTKLGSIITKLNFNYTMSDCIIRDDYDVSLKVKKYNNTFSHVININF